MEREEEKMNDIDTVIKWLEAQHDNINYFFFKAGGRHTNDTKIMYEMAKEKAEYFEDAANYLKQIKPKYSKWIMRSASLGASDVIICEECKFPTDKKRLYNYCPSCGAIMSIGNIYKIN